MPTPPIPAIAATRLTKSFAGVDVVRGLDLEVGTGQILGLIGPSGCGKTTTVRLLTGLLRPSSGSASIAGTPSTELSPAQRRHLGYLPQIPALFDSLSLAENLHFHASMYGLPLRRGTTIDEVLEFVELSDHRTKRVADVSGGMQRRLALAAALIHDPRYVFLDEPTAGIDPILRDRLWGQFRWLRDAGRSVVVTTQYVGEAAHCDLVGLISDGELLMLDTPAALRKAAFDGEVVDVRLERPATDAELERIGALAITIGQPERVDATLVRVVVSDADRAVELLDREFGDMGLGPVSCEEHLADFDEAFVKIVERHRVDVGEGRRVDVEGSGRVPAVTATGSEDR